MNSTAFERMSLEEQLDALPFEVLKDLPQGNLRARLVILDSSGVPLRVHDFHLDSLQIAGEGLAILATGVDNHARAPDTRECTARV